MFLPYFFRVRFGACLPISGQKYQLVDKSQNRLAFCQHKIAENNSSSNSRNNTLHGQFTFLDGMRFKAQMPLKADHLTTPLSTSQFPLQLKIVLAMLRDKLM